MTDTNKALAQQLLCNCHVNPNTGDGCGKCTNCIAAEALRKADALLPYVQHKPGCGWHYLWEYTCGRDKLKS